MVTTDRLCKWLEHHLVLPVRWYRIHMRNWRDLRQRCKACGCADGVNFHVPDDIWKSVVPQKYQNRVVCLLCFDRFAKEKRVDYAATLRTLYFAGHQTYLTLRVDTSNMNSEN